MVDAHKYYGYMYITPDGKTTRHYRKLPDGTYCCTVNGVDEPLDKETYEMCAEILLDIKKAAPERVLEIVYDLSKDNN